VKRRLLRSGAFVRAARRAVKKNHRLASDLAAALEALEQDAFHPSLRTHKVKGSGTDAILLLTVGGHDEVY
jgi:mRNA-degrading endonuclease YafQ of YafQ-DinJ toxin-antitoxin module